MDFIGPSSQKDTTANEVSASALRCQAARHKKRLREDIKGYITKAIDPNIRIYLTIETNRDTAHGIYYRDVNGEFVENNTPYRHNPHDQMLDWYLPDLELDEYENGIIPKHKISCAKDIVQLAEVDKSGLFLTVFFLSNFYVLLDYIKRKKLGYFVEKFNSKLQKIFDAKYSGRCNFSQHKFIDSKKIWLFRGLMKGANCQKFWLAIIKKFQNTVELTPADERVQLQLTNALDKLRHKEDFGEDSLKVVAKSLGVGYQRACRLVKDHLELNPNSELSDNTGDFPDEYDESEKEVIDSDVKVEVIDIDEQQSYSKYMTSEVEIQNEIPGLFDNKSKRPEQAQIIGTKRKRSEIQITENEFIFCKEEYNEESNDEIVEKDGSENHLT